MSSRNRSALCVSVLAAIAALPLLAGCETGQSANLTAADEKTPAFFAANRWTDEDSSGGASYWEFEGANKWTFRSGEMITFVSRIDAPVGTMVTWQLKAPDGQIVDQDESPQRWESSWRRAYTGPVGELIDLGGTGVWWVEWFIRGQRIGECAANLID